MVAALNFQWMGDAAVKWGATKEGAEGAGGLSAGEVG